MGKSRSVFGLDFSLVVKYRRSESVKVEGGNRLPENWVGKPMVGEFPWVGEEKYGEIPLVRMFLL